MKRIAIVVGHPRSGTFCEALARSYAEGARASGHEVTLFLLGKMIFDPVLREGFERVQPLEPDLKRLHDTVCAADHLVLIFPLWLGDMPAIMKGFLERVLQPDLIEPYKRHKMVRLLQGKSARIVITMGMPAFIYSYWFGSYSLKILKRMILAGMGARPIRSTLIGTTEKLASIKGTEWLAHLNALGRQGV